MPPNAVDRAWALQAREPPLMSRDRDHYASVPYLPSSSSLPGDRPPFWMGPGPHCRSGSLVPLSSDLPLPLTV